MRSPSLKVSELLTFDMIKTPVVALYVRRCPGVRQSRLLPNLYIFTIIEDMRKREFLGQMELMVLLATIRPGSDAYGVQICREICEKGGREVALASVYAALERLETKGLLTSS